MTAVNTKNVWIGTPDQLTTGAILTAAVGTALPTTDPFDEPTGFTSSGYVSEDGVSLTTDYSTNDIKDWSGSTVRKVLESFDGTISWSEIEMSYEAMCHAFGASNVAKTAATQSAGQKLKVSLGATLPPAQSWLFRMKDGNAKILIHVPNGQVTGVDEMTFNATDPIALPITLSCYPDSNGKSIYIYTDDGRPASA